MNNIIETPIIQELQKSFLDYSMSVITDRALPSAEDGVKPVIRRVLYSMFDKGWGHDKPHVKCAMPVADCMGRFHPHGDSSIYGALVAVSQPWTARYPLIDFHGNNGGRDGDPAGAYRYTECRLSKVATSTLDGLKKDAIEWTLNYSEDVDEPVYLPGLFPNLICNGGSGIAVGMACSHAPHNFKEVMQGILCVLDNPDSTVDDIMQHITGPDFPTGGLVTNQSELREAYATGKGRVRMRAEYVVEEIKGRQAIVYTSIPYKVSKEDLLIAIDSLSEEKKIEDIYAIRDESTMGEVRFVIELGKGANLQRAINQLYRMTSLECTYAINQVALVKGEPRLLSLKQEIEIYLAHQEQVLKNKSSHDLKKINARLHVLKGLLVALEDIDNVIKVIRGADSDSNAKVLLMGKYGLDEIQVKAILDMRLGRLAKLEKIELIQEQERLTADQTYLNAILNDREFALSELRKILTDYSEKFADPRRTTITQVTEEAVSKEIVGVPSEDCVVILLDDFTIKRVPKENFKTQNRNTKGAKNVGVHTATFSTNTLESLMVFTNKGNMYRVLVNNIPSGTMSGKGVPINSLIAFEAGETPQLVYYPPEGSNDNDKYVLFLTKQGVVKKTLLSEYTSTKKKSGLVAIRLREGDILVSVTVVQQESVLVLTKKGYGVKLDSKDIPPTSRATIGVKGINVSAGDQALAAIPITSVGSVAIIGSGGSGLRLDVSGMETASRGTKGVRFYKDSDIASALFVKIDDNILISGEKTSITIPSSSISVSNRGCVGNKLIKDSMIVCASVI